jgi:hypothetical protein
MKALRDVGTESPSGRLVIDILRLRENRAANSGENEITMLGSSEGGRGAAGNGRHGPATPTAAPVVNQSFPRVSVSVGAIGKSKKQLGAIVAILAAVLLLGLTLAIRSRNAAISPEANLAASPSPTVEASPSPSPSASPSPRRAAAKPAPAPKKKGNSFVNKVKRIFKNPF